MSKSITSLNVQLVTFTTDLAMTQVLAHLDQELSRDRAGSLFGLIKTASTKEMLEEGISRITRGNDFVFFLQMEHSWMRLYAASINRAVVYLLGNPVIAQTMMQHDIRAGYNIPPRLLIRERPNGIGCEVLYHLPSSVIVVDENAELRKAAEQLDEKLERLVLKVTQMESQLYRKT